MFWSVCSSLLSTSTGMIGLGCCPAQPASGSPSSRRSSVCKERCGKPSSPSAVAGARRTSSLIVGKGALTVSMLRRTKTRFAQSRAKNETGLVGGRGCTQPYSAALLNISAMSYGALSSNAILALNTAAQMGGFYHNTGEGGVSEFHLAPGGDIVWNVGTGYFGCRAADGTFDADKFVSTSQLPQIKMIELKLSQGAKPGHGGILPASKLTPTIAAARGVPLGQDCESPARHSVGAASCWEG